MQTNVAQFADPPRASARHRELPVWSVEQLHAFLDSVARQRLHLLWRFLAMTGCRDLRQRCGTHQASQADEYNIDVSMRDFRAKRAERASRARVQLIGV